MAKYTEAQIQAMQEHSVELYEALKSLHTMNKKLPFSAHTYTESSLEAAVEAVLASIDGGK